MRRSQMDAGIGAFPHPAQGQLRLLGALIIGGCAAILVFLSVFFPVIPSQAMAATVSAMAGCIGAVFAFALGLLVFVVDPWTPEETTKLVVAIIGGGAACVVLQWIAILGPTLFMFSFTIAGVVGRALAIAVVPFEELFCRAFLQTLFIRSLGPRAGPICGISSGAVVFGIFHFRVYALGIGFWVMIGVGAIIGVMYYLVPYLEVPIGIHLILNALAVIV